MTRDEFVAAGQTLFGESWVGPLASASGIDRRSIARMASGATPVPADLGEPLRRAALLIADLRAVIDRHAPIDSFFVNQSDDNPVTQRTRAILERSLNRIFDR